PEPSAKTPACCDGLVMTPSREHSSHCGTRTRGNISPLHPFFNTHACYQQLISGIILPRQMYGWDGNTAKAAPIGATSVFALAVGAVCCLAFHVFLLHSRTGFVGQWAS